MHSQVEGVMVVKRSKGLLLAGMAIGASVLTSASVFAADMDAMVTKAPMVAPAAITPPGFCGSAYDFFVGSCPLSWAGVTLYGTVDIGGTYQTPRHAVR